jgi:flagella basal body P-ring formation protein FlgA
MGFGAGLVFALTKEVNNTVKTSTLMKSPMQMLCRLLLGCLARGLGWAVVVLLFSAAANAKPSTDKTSPREALEASVRQWTAQTQKVPLDKVVLAPMDNRVQVRSCDQPLAMDLPFASAETVRVRCAQPVWQLYVRVNLPVKTPDAQTATKAEKPEMAPKRWVLVAAVALQRGMTLNESHVQRVEVDTSGLPMNVLEQASEVMHAEVVRDVRPGTPLKRVDIRPTVLVKRGQTVLMSVGQAQGFQISARVEALQDGRFGEQIKLKNRESGRELSGRVQGPNQVLGL